MGIRTRLIGAVLAGLTLTAAVGTVSASAAPAASAPADGKKKPDKDKPGVPVEAVKLLAVKLHISTDRARQVFKDLEKVTARGEAIVKDPAFAAIAKGLGITPQRLLDVLREVKQAIGKHEDKPKDTAGSPAK